MVKHIQQIIHEYPGRSRLLFEDMAPSNSWPPTLYEISNISPELLHALTQLVFNDMRLMSTPSTKTPASQLSISHKSSDEFRSDDNSSAEIEDEYTSPTQPLAQSSSSKSTTPNLISSSSAKKHVIAPIHSRKEKRQKKTQQTDDEEPYLDLGDLMDADDTGLPESARQKKAVTAKYFLGEFIRTPAGIELIPEESPLRLRPLNAEHKLNLRRSFINNPATIGFSPDFILMLKERMYNIIHHLYPQLHLLTSAQQLRTPGKL